MTTTITPIEAEGALSDDVLQAARNVVETYREQFEIYADNPWQGCGLKNEPLLTLLDQLIGAMEPVVNAIADNCWDDYLPVPSAGALGLVKALDRIASTLSIASAAPDASGWNLPSCSGKELV